MAWIYSGSHTSAGAVDYFVTDQEKGGTVATLSAPTSNKKAKALTEKRAVLIAAAPELLEACRYVVEWFDEWSVEIGAAEETLLDSVKAAIAKAEGQ